jgi:hypothetical protein
MTQLECTNSQLCLDNAALTEKVEELQRRLQMLDEEEARYIHRRSVQVNVIIIHSVLIQPTVPTH